MAAPVGVSGSHLPMINSLPVGRRRENGRWFYLDGMAG
jgi:hypothetical protein